MAKGAICFAAQTESALRSGVPFMKAAGSTSLIGISSISPPPRNTKARPLLPLGNAKVFCVWLKRNALSVSSPTMGMLPAKLKARAKLRPMRTPVNVPGPVLTTMRCKSLTCLCAFTKTRCTIGASASAWPRSISMCSSAKAMPDTLSNRQTAQRARQVSMARISMGASSGRKLKRSRVDHTFSQYDIAVKPGFRCGHNGITAFDTVIEISANQRRSMTLWFPGFQNLLKIGKHRLHAIGIKIRGRAKGAIGHHFIKRHHGENGIQKRGCRMTVSADQPFGIGIGRVVGVNNSDFIAVAHGAQHFQQVWPQ